MKSNLNLYRGCKNRLYHLRWPQDKTGHDDEITAREATSDTKMYPTKSSGSGTRKTYPWIGSWFGYRILYYLAYSWLSFCLASIQCPIHTVSPCYNMRHKTIALFITKIHTIFSFRVSFFPSSFISSPSPTIPASPVTRHAMETYRLHRSFLLNYWWWYNAVCPSILFYPLSILSISL